MSKYYLGLTALALAMSTSSAFADTVIVTSPAGVFTNPGSTNAAGPGAGYNTWFANNVRGGGSVGITTTYADHGNGSIQFSGPTGSKADFEYYFAPGGGFLLSDLTAFSYDEYRSSSSTAAGKYEPAMRLYVSDGTHTGYLVYEGVYNGQPTATVDVFSNVNILPDYVWATGNLPDNFNTATPAYNRTIADWTKLLPNLKVMGFSTGIGSGWDGSFDGAVDNITYATKSGGTTTYNFETPAANSPVPEPTSLTLLATGLVSAGAFYRKHRGFRRKG